MLKKHISSCKIELQVFTLRQRPGTRNFRALKSNLPQQTQDFTRETVGQIVTIGSIASSAYKKKRAYANQPVLENLQTPNAVPQSYSQEESLLLQEMLAIF